MKGFGWRTHKTVDKHIDVVTRNHKKRIAKYKLRIEALG